MGGDEVRYLLDTGVWLRGVNEQETIPPDVLKLLRAPDEMFGLSAISLWEVGKKVQIGKLPLPKDLPAWFEDALSPNLALFPITPEIVADAMRLPDFPNRDPSDELIVATARVHKLTVLTTDTKLKGYRHVRIHYFTPNLTKL
jgi:PIN domain nuclease of toxin-antitoxin system